MSNKFLRRGRPTGGRHASARPAPVVLSGLLPTPARLAQGGVVAVLAVSLCATVAATASAGAGGDAPLGISHTARAAAQVAAARHGAVDVAADAIVAAHAVQVVGATAAVSAKQLAALEAATAKLNELVASVDPAAAAEVAATVAPAPAAATSTTAPTTSPETAATTAAKAGATAPTTATTALTAGATAPTTAATAQPPTTTTATVPPASAPSSSAEPTSTVTLPADDPVPAETPSPTSTASTLPAVPTVPPSDGKEDAATAELRAAVATVASLSADVRESAEANLVAKAKAAKAAAAAAAKAAAASAAQAAADAAAQAAAEAAAAQRAAWKQSLQGYANGRIPDSALCGVSFDATVRLRCDAAEQLDVMNTAYKKSFGTDMVVTDSYRSYAGQLDCVRTKGYLCATPGTSNHGNGIAVDFGGGIETFGTQQHAWMDANAPGLQWAHPSWAEPGGSKPEAWHWEYTG